MRRASCVAAWLAAAVLGGCSAGTGDDPGADPGRDPGPTDLPADAEVRDLPDPRDLLDAADGPGPADAPAPDVPDPGGSDPGTDPGTTDVPTPCCTDALCRALGARCDPASCGCRAEAACCTDAFCSEAGGSCDAGACRCNLPYDACRFFRDDCPTGRHCLFGEATTYEAPRCLPAGSIPEGGDCDSYRLPNCAAGLVCVSAAGASRSRCVRPDCGVAEGAPSCPEGTVCSPLDERGLYGVCRRPCDPFDPATPCAADESCLAPCLSAWWTADCLVALPYGFLGGLCTPAPGGAPAGAAEPCPDGACRPGLVCVTGTCVDGCLPGVSGGPASCADGFACRLAPPVWNQNLHACFPGCDPWSTPPGAACDASSYCAAAGTCLPRVDGMPGLDEPCSPWSELPCDSGLVCADAAPHRATRCRPACLAGAAPGTVGGCAAGLTCFRRYDDSARAWTGTGHCDPPCDPWGAGDECPRWTWCEPRDRDPSTGRLVGRCVDADSGAEGQPCDFWTPARYPGCAAGLACARASESDWPSRCRPLCDPLAAVTGAGACPTGQACRPGWPTQGDAVIAGCVPE